MLQYYFISLKEALFLKKNINNSLRIGIISVLAIILLANALITYYVTQKNVHKVLMEKAISRSEMLSREASNLISMGNYEQKLQDLVDRESKQDGIVYTIIIDKNVTALAHSDHQKIGKSYTDEYTIDGAKNGNIKTSMWYAEVQEVWAQDIIVPIYVNGELFGGLDLGIIPEMGVSEILTKIIIQQIIICIFGILIMIIFIDLILKKLLKPLFNISDYVYSKSDLSFSGKESNKLIEEYSKRSDVIGVIVNSVNEIMSNMESNIFQTSKYIEFMAEGNFGFELDFEFKGEFVKIKKSLIDINNSMNDTLSRIKFAANDVSNGSQQVSDGSQLLSQGAMEQSSSIDELSSTIGDISETVKTTAVSALKVNNDAIIVGSKIENANLQMKEMLSAMNEIYIKSQEISKIMKAIDDIAFQTNILALNAAVEAARAGHAGKGFAVVADEVRNLAQKSAEAAKNTNILIQDSISAVESGAIIADGTAVALDEVAEDAKNMISTINDISEASSHQSDSITQVTIGIEQISNVVQTNAATAEESASVSEELSHQAQILMDLIEKFNLKK